MRASILTIAGLTWRRLWRGRSIWITFLLAALAVIFALVQLADVGWAHDPEGRFHAVVELWLRGLITVAAAIHLAPAVGEEVEARTYTYLWSRPFPRAALLLGKIAAILPLLVTLSALVLALVYPITTLGEAGEHLPSLGRAIAAGTVGALSAAAFAAGAGSLFPRHPFVFTLGYFLVAEQLLAHIPNLANVSFLYHVRVVAGLDSGSTIGALVGLGVLGGLWTAVGLWRVRTADYGTR